MRKFNFHYFPRDVDADDLIENFLVSAIASILIIRLFLQMTNFPRLGGQDLHIAHMLFGGFLMMLSLISLLVFLNKETKYITSITGGIGFGAFIDELGKFITKDNNYFYQPTIGIIYAFFVILFLCARLIKKYFKPNKTEYAINALETTKQIIMHNFDVGEKSKVLFFLEKSDPKNPIVRLLKLALKNVKASPISKPNILQKTQSYIQQLYRSVIKHPKFIKIVINFFVIASLLNLTNAILNFSKAQSFSDWGQLIFSILSGTLVAIGVLILQTKKSRKLAYEFFKYALLVSILLTQFFRFLEEELSAIFGLVLSLIILSVLQYLTYQENLITKES